MIYYFFIPGSTNGYGPGGREIFSFAGNDSAKVKGLVAKFGTGPFASREAADEAARADAAREAEYKAAREVAAAGLFREKPTWPVVARLLRELAESHKEYFTPSGLCFVAECCGGDDPITWDRVAKYRDSIAREAPIVGAARGHHVAGAAMYADQPRAICDVLRAAIYIAPGPRAYWSPRRIHDEVEGLLSELARLVGDADLPAKYGFGLSIERLRQVNRQVYAAR